LAFVADKPEEYLGTIGILFLIVLLVSMGDVALDALAVKELEDPNLAGYLQANTQGLGSIIGSIIVINAARPDYWTFLGIEGILCSTQTLLIAIAAVGFVIALLIHFLYTERGKTRNI
jgi:high-affinity Fe2+/Pb2+ permease